MSRARSGVFLAGLVCPMARGLKAVFALSQLAPQDNMDLVTSPVNGTNASACMVAGVASAFMTAVPKPPPAQKHLLFTALIGHAGTEPDKPVITVQLELPEIAVTFAREASVERVPGCTNMRAPCAAVVPTLEPAIYLASGERTMTVQLAPSEAIRVNVTLTG